MKQLWMLLALALAGAPLGGCTDDEHTDESHEDDNSARETGDSDTEEADSPAEQEAPEAGSDDAPEPDGEDEEDEGANDNSQDDQDASVDDGDAPDPEQAAFSALSEVADVVVTEANDLRGLTFAPDGAIYAAGYSDVLPEDRQIVVLRIDADGSLDEDFGVGGVVTHNLVAGGDEQVGGMVVLSEGDLVLAVNLADNHGGTDTVVDTSGGPAVPRPAGQDVALVRLSSDGALVNSFGVGGILPVTFGWAAVNDPQFPAPTYDSSLEERRRFSGPGFPTDTAFDLLLDDSGENDKLVILGFGSAPYDAQATDQRSDTDRYILRLLADGSTDTSFNGDGSPYVFDSFAQLNDNGRHGLVEPDGSIVSSGYTNFGEGLGNHVVLIRLLPDGTADPGFGFGFAADEEAPGVTKFNPFLVDGGFAEAYGVAKQSTGRYVTTGYGRATAENTPSTLGYITTDSVDLVSFGVEAGDLSPEFGTDGVTAIQSEELALPSGTEERGRDVIALPDDRVIHAGRFAGTAALYVTLPDGRLDTEQGEAGVLLYPHPTLESQFYNVALSPDGKRIAASTDSDAAGARLILLQTAD